MPAAGGRGRSRGGTSTAIALAVHAAVFAALVAVPPRRGAPPEPAASSRPEEPSIEVSLEDAPEPRRVDVTSGNGDVTDGHIEVAAGPVERGGGAAAVRAAEPAPPPDDARGTEGDAPPAAPSAGGVTFGAPRVAIDGPNPFLEPGSVTLPDSRTPATGREPTEAERTADAKRRVEASLRKPARDRERELGLGPEGPVLTALGEATSTTTTPVRGRAVFFAVANGAGDVVSIEVAECDGARGTWAEAAAIALGALKGKKLRVPSSATRAEMRIEVTSAWKLPSGQDPGADVSVLGIPVAKGEGKDSTKVEILNPLPKVTMVPITKDVQLPVVVWQLNVLSTNGDPANIAAKARRIVHTRLLDSKVM